MTDHPQAKKQKTMKSAADILTNLRLGEMNYAEPPPPVFTPYPISIAAIEGDRECMEDTWVDAQDLLAVQDGHVTARVAKYIQHHLYAEFKKSQDFKTALATIDENVLKDKKLRGGSTVAAVWFPSDKSTMVTANVGDSRIVLCRNGKAIQLTRDHKPEDQIERSRIEGLGGLVFGDDVKDQLGKTIFRIDCPSGLSLSRALGDRDDRPYICSDPDIETTPIQEEDDFIVLATDGLWGTLKNQEVIEIIMRLREVALEKGESLEYIAQSVAVVACRKNPERPQDNTTVSGSRIRRTQRCNQSQNRHLILPSYTCRHGLVGQLFDVRKLSP